MMKSKNLKHWVKYANTRTYLFILVLATLIYFSPIILTEKTIWVSEFDHYVPDLHIILSAWEKFEQPLYTDLVWGGFPHYKILHNPTWYPPIMILGLLGFDAFVSAKLLLILHFLFGMIGMFFLARKYVNIHYSLLAGMLFGFNPVMVNFVNGGWLTFVMAMVWLPWFFLFWFHSSKLWKKITFPSLALAMMLHSGGIFIVYYSVIFIVLVELIQSIKSKNIKPLLVLASVLLLFFAVAFFKILPGLEYSKATPRALPLSYDDFLAGKTQWSNLPSTTIGFGLILSLFAMFYSFRKRHLNPVHIVILVFILASLGVIFLKLFYEFVPLFKSQSEVLSRIVYPTLPFLITIPLAFIQDSIKKVKIKQILIVLFIISMFFNIRLLNVGDYKAEIDQNQALQYIAKDTTCCWRVWQAEETSGPDWTLNAYTTPLNIRTLFGFTGSEFWNVTYMNQFLADAKISGDYVLKKYDIKYFLTKTPLNPPPDGYKFVKKFPESPAFRPHMSGQYVYVRINDSSRKQQS